jgi:hypothetical protein
VSDPMSEMLISINSTMRGFGFDERLIVDVDMPIRATVERFGAFDTTVRMRYTEQGFEPVPGAVEELAMKVANEMKRRAALAALGL